VTSPAPEPRILAVRFSSIGDIVLITPLLRALKTRHPDCYLAVATKEEFAPLLRHNPHIDRIIEFSAGNRLSQLARDLRAERFTHHLDLHGSMRSRALRWLVRGRWHGYPKHRLARTALIRTKRNIYPLGTPPVVERFFAAARDLGVAPDGGPPDLYLDQLEKEQAKDWLSNRGLGKDRPVVVVAPMAAHFTKRWPVEHWQALVSNLTAGGVDVAVVGGSSDVATCESVADAGGTHAASAAGTTGLLGTASLIERAKVVVAGDTGVMHMSTALDTPLVALFGPTVKAFGFFPYQARATVLELDLACRPCSKMGGPVCPLGHHRCLVDISPGEVAAAVEEWLGQGD
jgi:heptosyltransferase-2